MSENIRLIAYDLGTGGIKASLYNGRLETVAKSFMEYPTLYPRSNMHEQRPGDWWDGVVKSTEALLKASGTDPMDVACIALSGHSCVAVPLDENLRPVADTVPIWSDTRAGEEIAEFFSGVDEEEWYLATGNGFPASCYSLFKLMWFRKHCPEQYARTRKVAGSKDYINLLLTGKLYTDPSYASSTGAYLLKEKKMSGAFLAAAGISEELYPEIVPSHRIIGTLTESAARELGLHTGVRVACGGVDNACMALGAVGSENGAVYISLGSSSWIPVNSVEPVLDFKTKPYVFAHIEENMFTSAYSIFAGGSSYKWCRDTLCPDLSEKDAYRRMDEMAGTVPPGAGGILFNPSLAGGTSQDKSINIRGAFIGLHQGTSREALIRAVLEGITLNLRSSMELLGKKVPLSGRMLICGGGSRSSFWMQMFADVFGMEIIKSNVDQDAASLGAAAICARALGLYPDYSFLSGLRNIEKSWQPDPEKQKRYAALYPVFLRVSELVSDIGDIMANTEPERF